MTTIGSATYKLTADDSDFTKGLQSAEQKSEASFNRIAQRSRALGTLLTAFGAPLAAGIGLAANTFANFEQKMANVQAVSGATASEFEALQATAKTMGETTVFTAVQSAEALQFMAMAGLNAQDSISALPEVLNLAAAGQLELGDSANIVTNIMAGYGIAADDVGRASDVLVTGFTSANTDLLQLGEAFKLGGPVAKAAGLEFEETSSALSLLGNAGLQATVAGTGLRAIITRLLKPSGEANAILNRLGVTATDSSGKMLPLTDIMRQFEAVGLTAADAMTIFGQRGGPAMLALLQQGFGRGGRPHPRDAGLRGHRRADSHPAARHLPGAGHPDEVRRRGHGALDWRTGGADAASDGRDVGAADSERHHLG